MKIYIAARYSRKDEMKRHAQELWDMGHWITSQWIWRNEDDEDEVSWRGYAEEDMIDLLKASTLIQFSDEQYTPQRGGKHVELGMAVAWHKRIYIVGPKENVFHCLLQCKRFDSWEECVESLGPAIQGTLPLFKEV